MTSLHSLVGVATSLLLVGQDINGSNLPTTADVMTDPRQGQGWREEQQRQHEHHQQQLQHQAQQPTHGYYDQVPLLPGQWGAPSAQRPGHLQQPQPHSQHYYDPGHLDGRLYDNAAAGYFPYNNPTTNVNYPSDTSWAVTGAMDISTPQPYQAQPSPMDSYPAGQQRLPQTSRDTRHLNPDPPNSSHGRRPTPVNFNTAPPRHTPTTSFRPPLTGRSATAPIPSLQKKPTASSDSEEDFVPSSELGLDTTPNLDIPLASTAALPAAPATTAPRTRKRQRIPHTAVERRYRENLNAHLEKLRQAVPTLATPSLSALSLSNQSAQTPTSGVGEGARPSKCEILNGAIEHINAVERANAALRQECEDLRRRAEQVEGWYGGRSIPTGGLGGGGGGFG